MNKAFDVAKVGETVRFPKRVEGQTWLAILKAAGVLRWSRTS